MSAFVSAAGGLQLALITPWAVLLLFTLPRLRTPAVYLLPIAPLPALVLAFCGSAEAVVWRPESLPGIGFVLDATAGAFLLPAALIWSLAGAFVLAWFGQRPNPGFAALWCLSLGGSLGLVLADGVLAFYVALGVMTFAAYGLIVYSRDTAARQAGYRYFLMMSVGELCLLTAVALLAARSAPGEFLAFEAVLAGAPTVPLVLFGIGFGLKLGVVGLHSWLPRAHSVAPVPASAVLSGVMIKAGALGWWRVVEPGLGNMPSWGMTLVVLGVIGTFYGALRAMFSARAKTVLAWSSVSQMGLIVVVAGLALSEPAAVASAWTATTVFVLHHGLVKAGLFLGVGVFMRTGQRTLVWVLLACLALALAGAPFTGGLLAKTALGLAATPTAYAEWMPAMLYLSSVVTMLAMLRFLAVVRQERAVGTQFGGWWLLGTWCGAVVLALALPWRWFAGEPLVADSVGLSAVWGASWPLLLALLVASAWRWLPVTGLGGWGRPLPCLEQASVQRLWQVGALCLTRLERGLHRWPIIGHSLLVLALVLLFVLGQSAVGSKWPPF
ncbi:hypothetical protein CAI21_09965 [Alkalilimnicola ehrlichii]|uniref:NADH:quinone oxidoreductase/Mrp antiporter transmembrane domain-containing protein n=1 Tax=Alkalilimnicola ehrlichii TaxID=351052 RepID=A0A3E0WV93_9GAMM|nr:complex I subunit 5 family protein [Alkalilimnicola ehrlichii]RFA29382.1 hypothetical protein CAI21_09965 [Alkalilimnicola ehrlichii]RFA36894.1 hypothetical protein CAL65_10295 [Alkalilimnicola ehrlichii]